MPEAIREINGSAFIQVLPPIKMKKLTVIILVLIFGFSSCYESKRSNYLDSDDFNSREKRVEVLKNEIKSYSDFEDSAFELFNVNGFSNSRTIVPGASSWDYKFVIKVTPSDIDKWTEGMIKTEAGDYNGDWMDKVIEKRNSEWKTESQPEFYTRKGDNVAMIVYRSEGIIFKRVIHN